MTGGDGPLGFGPEDDGDGERPAPRPAAGAGRGTGRGAGRGAGRGTGRGAGRGTDRGTDRGSDRGAGRDPRRAATSRLVPTSRYAWLVGIAAILVAGFLVIGSTRPAGPGAVGLPAGAQLPPFAAVLATSDVVCDSDDDPCDANVAASGARDQGEAGSRPACEVRGPTVLNLCELTERGPLVLGLMVTRETRCVRSFDVLTDLQRRHPGLQVAVVAIRGGLEELRQVVRERRWGWAVGWDRDGVLASLYGVATCPHIAVARWRGRVQATLLGSDADTELERETGRAVAASRRAGWRP